MSTENLITIVNENDEPIGSATISEARQKGLIHRIVRIMVEDSNNRILLQKRSNNMESYPGCWDHSAAGHVDYHEGYLSAAKRELFEEIGIIAESLEEIDTYFSENESGGQIIKRFNRAYKHVSDTEKTKLQESEVEEVKWFTLDEIKRYIKDYPDKVTDGLEYVISRYY